MSHLQTYINENDFIAYDTETNGVEKGSTIIGFSIAASTEIGYYVILEAWDPAKQTLVSLETKEKAKECIQALVGKKLIMQNAGFDCARTFENFGIELMPYVHTDTLLLGHLLNENRQNGLKERGVELYGEDARKEQQQMKDSVHKNGGVLTKTQYELYKADADLIALYGAKDAVLTLKIFYNDVPLLYAQGLDRFFYEEETMPLCRLVTYEMNTTGLKVDLARLSKLKQELETEILEAEGFIHKEIASIVKEKYPGTSKSSTFNITAVQQMSWLLFCKLGNEFNTLTKGGRDLCKKLNIKVPYHAAAKRAFIKEITNREGEVYEEAKFNYKTNKMSLPKKIGVPWKYLSSGKETLGLLAPKYKWVAKRLEHAKASKLLSTYVLGIEEKTRYGVIRPSFLQHGTTSGRFSCKQPNFQNLPRDDKRVKACIVARPGKVFVGADHSQLEPRVFSSVSQDPILLECFRAGQDFYSVVGAPIFGKTDCSMFKKDANSFAELYPELRNISKAFALATPYGTSAFQQSMKLGLPATECEEIIYKYFATYENVHKMMLDSHEQAKSNGVVYSLFGRPRRIPDAMDIPGIYGKKVRHSALPYAARNLLNLSMNHRVQSTAASIMNRNMIAVARAVAQESKTDPRWNEVRIVLQVHDSLVLEGPEELARPMTEVLREGMENSVQLPGVALIADPKIGNDLSQV